MARLKDVPDATYAALARIRRVALESFSSLFNPAVPVWTQAELQRLRALYVERPDFGEDSFFDKLKGQLAGAGANATQLAAELLYVQQFFTTQTSPEKKLDNVQRVLSWSDRAAEVPAWAIEALGRGLSSNRSFNQHRPNHLAWMIEFLAQWHLVPDRADLLSTPWKFREFTMSIEGSQGAHQSMREAWLYVAFPDAFEAITSRTDKTELRDAFLAELDHPATENVDADLLEIRQKLTPRFGPDFHYYGPEVAALWRLRAPEVQDGSDLTLAQAAERVLMEFGQPTSVTDLWQEIAARKLYASESVDPERNLYTVLYRNSTDFESERGPAERPFIRTAPSTFGLVKLGHLPGERASRAIRPPSKREIIELLRRDELLRAVEHYGIDVADRRVNDNLVHALVRSKKVRVAEVLGWLLRDRLKDICIALEVDDVGREKSVLIERILGEPASADADDKPATTPTTGGRDGAQQLVNLLGSQFKTGDIGDGWPLRGALILDDISFDVSVYVRPIGGSSRGNPLERRFQNPSQQSPIVDEPDRYELLLGVWAEQGAERTVICAFDAYRRMDRTTRFSCFMPLSLLEQAADTGFASHENNRGETLYAFRPENISRYLQTFLQNETFQKPHEELAPKRRADRKAAEQLAQPQGDAISIRPQVGMYSAFARLNYKPWFALAEFVDNSIQSFLANQARLAADGHVGPLVIDINLDDNEISITDRAGGIAWKDFPRAFSPASPPDDATGLSEFGLGMKAAACWFSRKWTVRTSAMGEAVERTVSFDVPLISKTGLEKLPIESRPSRDSDHFTVLTMQDLRVHPRGRTLAKIREHLSSIYRVLMKEDVVRLRLTMAGKTDNLTYEEPELLEAPHHRTPNAVPRLWRTEFVVDLDNRRVSGWAGVLKSGSHSRAGFSVFRRRRLIEGSIGETYKPALIFGSPNSFCSQRIVGEIFVDGFDVTHTKDGIQWGGHEDEVLESIRRQIDAPKLPLLDQADGFRVRKTAASLPKGFGDEALAATADAIAQVTQDQATSLSTAVVAAVAALNGSAEEPSQSNAARNTYPTSAHDGASGPVVMQQRQARLKILREGVEWDVRLELVRDPAMDFYETSAVRENGRELISVRINLDHEFSVSYLNDNEAAIEPLIRFVAALSLSEKLARESGVKHAAVIRQNANLILRTIGSDRSNK